ncbi:ABC transporter ATP-binding protein [Clostridium mobile]|nr:ABC transporter ATP-binding protein [Clostridium mobile]
MKVKLKNLCSGYGNNKIINNINLEVALGDSLCILGPNGAGKTTLFKTVLGFIKPIEGEVLVNEKDIFKISRKELAKIIAYVPQVHVQPFSYTVLDVVLMGRTPYIGNFSSPSLKDKLSAEEILYKLNIYNLRDKIYTEISGGEKQLVLIGRALAQESQVLIMDEPTSNLDFGNQIRVLEHVKSLVKEDNIALVMTTHHPNHAFICSNKVALMDKGSIIKYGSKEEVLTEGNLKSLYGIDEKYCSFKGETYEKNI